MIKWEQLVFPEIRDLAWTCIPSTLCSLLKPRRGRLRCETSHQVCPALQSALNLGRPSVLKAVVDPLEPDAGASFYETGIVQGRVAGEGAAEPRPIPLTLFLHKVSDFVPYP
jgi:hypothetical protein